jgi:ADP-L-glycero-D-manno-heptose 6-epimerase
MRILVTGGAGFIGSNLAKRLEREDPTREVVVLDDFSNGDFNNLVDFHGNVITGGCDAAEPCGRCEVIFHEASITDTTVMDQNKMMTNNVEGFRNVLGWAAKWKARVVWASSAATYGNLPAPNRMSDVSRPLNVYGYSKLAMERLARRWSAEHPDLPIVGLRYFNVYGPGEQHKGKFASMIWQLSRQMKLGKRPRIFTAGEQKRDFVSIEDVIAVNLLAMNTNKVRGAAVFNAGCGKAATFNEVIAGLNAAMKMKLEPVYFENPYGFFQNHTEADISETVRDLGYCPMYTDIAQGIAHYMNAMGN